MSGFLKKILEPSQQDTSDHLTRRETPSSNTSRNPSTENAQPSAYVVLPRDFIRSQASQPTHVTFTPAVQKLLAKVNKQRKAAPHQPAEQKPNGEPQKAGSEEKTKVPSKPAGGSSTRGTGMASGGKSTTGRSLPQKKKL